MEPKLRLIWILLIGLATMLVAAAVLWRLAPELPLPDLGPPPPPEEHPGITLHGVDRPQQIDMEWTAYFIAPVQQSESGRMVTFEDRQGKKHNLKLTRKSYRDAEMEAVVVGIDRHGEKRFAYRTAAGQWRELPEGSQGIGNRMNPLVPMRHVASDQSRFPYGSMIYVPVAAGFQIGNRTMDGYFWVGDTGGRIRGQHMDLFVGENENYEAFVKANHPTHHPTRVYRLPRPASGFNPKTKEGLAKLMLGTGKLAPDEASDPERITDALVAWQQRNPFIPEAEYGNATAATTLWFLTQLGHELAQEHKPDASADGEE